MLLKERVFKAEPRRLARLLDLDNKARRPWRERELSAILQHQLSASIRFDVLQDASEELKEDSRTVTVQTFGELFRHPTPPIDLLRSVKDFAKANQNHPASALPNEIARLIYFASIVVAQTRCNQRITRLSEKEVRAGVAWALVQDWVDERTKSLFREAFPGTRPVE